MLFLTQNMKQTINYLPKNYQTLNRNPVYLQTKFSKTTIQRFFNPNNSLQAWRASSLEFFQNNTKDLEKKREEKIDYRQILESMSNLTEKDMNLRGAFQGLMEETRNMQDSAFQDNKHVREILYNIDCEKLMVLAIETFIGKVSTPKNEPLSKF